VICNNLSELRFKQRTFARRVADPCTSEVERKAKAKIGRL
jgi:hypothetical protein